MFGFGVGGSFVAWALAGVLCGGAAAGADERRGILNHEWTRMDTNEGVFGLGRWIIL